MSILIRNTDDLVKHISESEAGMTHVIIVKGEEIYAYTCDEPKGYEKLQCFNDPDVQEGPWRDVYVWLQALANKLDKHYPIAPFSGSNIDFEILQQNIQELLNGNLSEKQIRDMIGITNELNEIKRNLSELTIDELLEQMRNQNL